MRQNILIMSLNSGPKRSRNGKSRVLMFMLTLTMTLPDSRLKMHGPFFLCCPKTSFRIKCFFMVESDSGGRSSQFRAKAALFYENGSPRIVCEESSCEFHNAGSCLNSQVIIIDDCILDPYCESYEPWKPDGLTDSIQSEHD